MIQLQRILLPSILTLQLAALTFSAGSGAEFHCWKYFASLSPRIEERKLAKLSSGREMYYALTPAEHGKPTVVLIHGLGDDMEDVAGIAKSLKDKGHGVLRVDLHGHGKTLENFATDHAVPAFIDFKTQVDDLEELVVKHLRLKEIATVGHSYGGAVALELATRLENKVKVLSVTQMSPYVIRLDTSLQDSIYSGSLFFDAVEKGLGMIAPKNEMHEFVDPSLETLKKQSESIWQKGKRLTNQLQVDKALDPIRDPIFDEFLSTQYRMYFLYRQGLTRKPLTDLDRKLIENKVKAALAETKGIRSYNVFDPEFKPPKNIPIQLIMGEKDFFVPMALLNDYKEMLVKKGLTITSVVMENSDHLYPSTRSSETSDLILKQFGPIWDEGSPLLIGP